jgi:hypothetical protein
LNAGCNLALHCNGNLKEMTIVAKNSPKVNSFIIKKTSEFYKNFELMFITMIDSDSPLFEVDVENYNGPLRCSFRFSKSPKS